MAPQGACNMRTDVAQLQTCGRALQVLRSPPPTGTVGIGNLSTTSGSWLRLSSGRPLVSVSTQLQRYAVRASATSVDIHFLADKRRRAQFGRWLGSGVHRGVEAQQAVGRAFARRSGSVRPVRPHPTGGSRRFRSHPTDDQAMLRDAAKELATNVLRPAASAADSARGIPPEVAAAGAAMGLHPRRRADDPGRNRRVGDRGDRRARPGGTGPRRPGPGRRPHGDGLGRHRRPLWHLPLSRPPTFRT